ncbi:helix-hairpin-helix domain-containing protein [Rhizobium deserti]|uniref:Helix-hairpin-helix domain-containing protein n=1 Tax=Rhizobium deserti TaxID=2547961 RepID=A0A4R5UFU6_9HYPH|nr:helix-hairpin-helix domain-containing protein [Rhizobium deserti]
MPQQNPSTRNDLVIRSALPGWLIKVLRDNGVKRLSRLQEMTDHQLLKLPGVGSRSIEMIRTELQNIGPLPSDPTAH